MSALAALRPARRLQLGVLVLWLCCLGAATASPWLAAAPDLASTCGAHGGAAGTADDGPGTTAGHGLKCPGCLPLAAPPPVPMAAIAAEGAPPALPLAAIATPFLPDSAARPPARAPPRRLSNHEVTS